MKFIYKMEFTLPLKKRKLKLPVSLLMTIRKYEKETLSNHFDCHYRRWCGNLVLGMDKITRLFSDAT
jgi:hypothetical protein